MVRPATHARSLFSHLPFFFFCNLSDDIYIKKNYLTCVNCQWYINKCYHQNLTLYRRRAIGGIGNKAGQNQSGLQLEVVTVDTTVLPLDIDT